MARSMLRVVFFSCFRFFVSCIVGAVVSIRLSFSMFPECTVLHRPLSCVSAFVVRAGRSRLIALAEGASLLPLGQEQKHWTHEAFIHWSSFFLPSVLRKEKKICSSPPFREPALAGPDVQPQRPHPECAQYLPREAAHQKEGHGRCAPGRRGGELSRVML